MIPKMRGKAVAKPRSALSQEPVVKLHGPGRDGRPAKVLQYALASCLAQSCGQGRVASTFSIPSASPVVNASRSAGLKSTR